MARQSNAQASLLEDAPSLEVSAQVGKPRLLYLLFCDWYSQTKENKANFVGVFDSMKIKSRDTAARAFWLCFRTVETIGEDLSIVIYSPENKAVGQIRFEGLQDPDAAPDAPHYFDGAIHGTFPVTTEGLYWVAVFFNGELLGGNGFTITRLAADKTEAAEDDDDYDGA